MMILKLARAVVLFAFAALSLYAADQYGGGDAKWLAVAFGCAWLIIIAGANAKLDHFLETSNERRRRTDA